MNALFEWFQLSQPFAWGLLALLVFTFLVGLKGFVFVVRLSLHTEAFLAQIQKLVLADNIDRAIKLSNAGGVSRVALLTKQALIHANRDPDGLTDAVDLALASTLRRLHASAYMPGLAVLGLLAGATAALHSADPVPPLTLGLVCAITAVFFHTLTYDLMRILRANLTYTHAFMLKLLRQRRSFH